jgi:CRISPR-associated protein (TIGR03984 family)
MAEQPRQVTLSEATDAYKNFLGGELDKAYAILYAPNKCFLALLNKSGAFEVKDNAAKFDISRVFEARIFNKGAELRWLNEADGKGQMAIISDASFPDAVGTIPQTYLLWGRSTGIFDGDWTQFAEARIGAFHVPLPKVPAQDYARLMAIEYLKECEDGNVAVADERLTGIESYKGA